MEVCHANPFTTILSLVLPNLTAASGGVLNPTANKPAKIIPYIIGYQFDDYGLSVVFDPLRYPSKYTREANEIFLNFLLENIEYIQTIQQLSKMSQFFYVSKSKNVIRPFKEIIEDYKNEYIYDIKFIRTIKSPLNYNELNSMIMSFVIFFPIYYSLLEIAKNKQCSFKNIVSKLSYAHLLNDYPDEQNIDLSNVTETVNIKIDETKFIKSGIRWQVFERDDFKCVACGKSSHDGAILHVDHIIPRSKGGENVMENYQTLCHLCNIGKSNKSDENLRKK